MSFIWRSWSALDILTARGAISGNDSIVYTVRTVVELLYNFVRVSRAIAVDALVSKHLGTRVNGPVDHST